MNIIAARRGVAGTGVARMSEAGTGRAVRGAARKGVAGSGPAWRSETMQGQHLNGYQCAEGMGAAWICLVRRVGEGRHKAWPGRSWSGPARIGRSGQVGERPGLDWQVKSKQGI